MRIFKINEKIEIVCESQKTRSGFRHLATLLFNGIEQEKAKCCYLNRTWERYEFQTVLIEVGNKAFKNKIISEEQRKEICEFSEKDHTDWSDFKAVSMVAKVGDILCENQKDKNDWKARMLKAGFENKGLIMPDDWETLDENTKGERLNAVIKLLGEEDENKIDKSREKSG